MLTWHRNEQQNQKVLLSFVISPYSIDFIFASNTCRQLLQLLSLRSPKLSSHWIRMETEVLIWSKQHVEFRSSAITWSRKKGILTKCLNSWHSPTAMRGIWVSIFVFAKCEGFEGGKTWFWWLSEFQAFSRLFFSFGLMLVYYSKGV